MQTMNVATGGTMIQDIPTEIYGIWNAEEILALPSDQIHRNYADMVNTGNDDPTSYHFHHVKLEDGSFLIMETGFHGKTAPLVLSSHHQSVENLGKGWKVAAQSMDGKVVEAIEHEQYPFVFGVQFHPEKPGLLQEVIKNTDSFAFHLAYWKYLADALQKIRRK